jgi:hypothetical protein
MNSQSPASQLTTAIRSLWERARASRLLFSVAAIGLTAAALGYLIYREWPVLVGYPWQFNPWALAGAFILFSLTLWLAAWIWSLIMNGLAVPLPAGRHVRYYMISNVAKRLPGTIWYVAGRVQFYRAEGIDSRLVAVGSGIELVVLILGGILAGLAFSIPLLLERQVSPWYLGLVLLIGLGLVQPPVVNRLLRLMKIEAGQVTSARLLGLTLLYAVGWTVGGLIIFLVGNVVTPIPLAQVGYVIGAWVFTGLLSQTVFFLPSNFGITEVSLSLLLSRILPSPVAVLIAILARLSMTAFELIWAGIFALLLRRN